MSLLSEWKCPKKHTMSSHWLDSTPLQAGRMDVQKWMYDYSLPLNSWTCVLESSMQLDSGCGEKFSSLRCGNVAVMWTTEDTLGQHEKSLIDWSCWESRILAASFPNLFKEEKKPAAAMDSAKRL